MKKMRIFPVTLIIGALLLSANEAESKDIGKRWDGLAGEALKRAVAADCRPLKLVTAMGGADGCYEIFRQTDVASDGRSYINRFSGDVLEWPPSLTEGPARMILCNVIPWEWWDVRSGVIADVRNDLYNLVPSLPWVGELKGRYAPGIVTDAEFDNGYWKVGMGIFDGMTRHLWQPPAGYEGDFARIMFYLFTVYPNGVDDFGLDGALYSAGNYYPGISEPGLRQLLVWHRGDPVDWLEMRRNEIFSRHQGNLNPFVECPALAEYLWGNMRGIPFGDGDGFPGDMVGAALKAVYSIGESRINLQSEHVPADARWSVDGRDVDAPFLVPSELGVGVHELRFSCGECRGKILIEVTGR